MKLSDWQLTLVRDALRAYKTYGSDQGGRDYSWTSVAEGIAEYTNFEVSGKDVRHFAERLRQFVEGVTVRGKRKFPVPSQERLEAIVAFVTHDELRLLTREEFEQGPPSYQAPLRLLDYLDQTADDERLLPTARMEGWFRAQRLDGEFLVIREITLGAPSEEGLIEAGEIEDYYPAGMAKQFVNPIGPPIKQALDARKARTQFAGWAILTPEDNLLFFLKNVRNGRNRYYFSMAADAALWSGTSVKFLVLLDHEFPLELEEADTDAAIIARKAAEETARRVSVFMRFDIRRH